MVDRVYRALFVYSVGFFELLRKILEHTDKNFTIITAIWKVFSILLEYCCRTDYRMLIQEITKQHKLEFDKLDAAYQEKFRDQAINESLLKVNQEKMTKELEDKNRELFVLQQTLVKMESEAA